MNLVTWGAMLAFAFLWLALAIYVSQWYLVGFVAILALGRLSLERIICPNCGKPITFEEGGARSLRHLLAPFKRFCANCGWDLRQ